MESQKPSFNGLQHVNDSAPLGCRGLVRKYCSNLDPSHEVDEAAVYQPGLPFPRSAPLGGPRSLHHTKLIVRADGNAVTTLQSHSKQIVMTSKLSLDDKNNNISRIVQ